MTSCPFCARIEARQYDAGDPHAVTFEPLNPVTPGHRLFVPRAHVADALEYPEITGHVMAYAARWAAGHEMKPCNLITSAGAEATQTVFHLHVHVVPRREGDGLCLPWTAQTGRAGFVRAGECGTSKPAAPREAAGGLSQVSGGGSGI